MKSLNRPTLSIESGPYITSTRAPEICLNEDRNQKPNDFYRDFSHVLRDVVQITANKKREGERKREYNYQSRSFHE